jgi:hypothetical protein
VDQILFNILYHQLNINLPALTNSDDITIGDTDESRADMGSQVLVSLLITVVLGDIVQVITANNDGALHLGRNDNASQNTTTNRDIRREWALFVDVVALDGFTGSLEAQTNILVPAVVGALFGDLLGHGALAIKEDPLLFLEGFFSLCNGFGKVMMNK